MPGNAWLIGALLVGCVLGWLANNWAYDAREWLIEKGLQVADGAHRVFAVIGLVAVAAVAYGLSQGWSLK